MEKMFVYCANEGDWTLQLLHGEPNGGMFECTLCHNFTAARIVSSKR